MEDSKSLDDTILEYISHIRFHQKFILPATETHGPLRITYSLVGVEGERSEDAPVMLWCGGMFETRWVSTLYHSWAAKEGLRILRVDRYVSIFLISILIFLFWPI
jgi:predicted membrane channel-forming protein YqfA (hemolysin III family)